MRRAGDKINDPDLFRNYVTAIWQLYYIHLHMLIDQSIGRQGNNKKAKETKTKALQNQMTKSMHFSKQKQNNVYTILIKKKKKQMEKNIIYIY